MFQATRHNFTSNIRASESQLYKQTLQAIFSQTNEVMNQKGRKKER